MCTEPGELATSEAPRRDRLQILSEATRAFAEATMAPQLLAEVIARHTAEALDAASGLSLVSSDGAWLEPVAHHDPDPSKRPLLEAIAGDGRLPVDGPHPLARSLRTGECTILPAIDDAILRARFPRPEQRAAAEALDIKTVLFVPLRARAQTIGGLALIRHGHHARRFEDADVQFAQTLAGHVALAITNARLFAEAQRELTERSALQARLRILQDLARQFAATTSDYQQLLDLVTRRVGELIGELCAVRFVSDDGEWLEQAGSLYHPDPALAAAARAGMLARRQRVADGLVGPVVTSGQPMVVAAVPPGMIAAHFEDRFRPLVDQLAIASLAAVPLRARGKVIGVMTLTRSEGSHPYTADELDLLQHVVGHATLAIANARLLLNSQRELAERRRLADRLRTLSEVAREFAAATGDYDQLLDLVARRVGELVGDLGLVRTVSADGGWLESLGAIYHADPEVVAATRAVMLSQPIRVGEGLAGRVAAGGGSVRVSIRDADELAARTDPRFHDFVARFAIASVIAVPLSSEGRVIGVLSVARNSAAPPYDDDDLRWVEDLAAHASLAIANGRLLEASRVDFMERMRTEEVLRRSFLEAAPDAVVIVDPRGRIILVNSQAETLFGCGRADLIGQPIEALVPPDRRAAHAGYRAAYLAAPQVRHMAAGVNLSAQRRDGTTFAAEISLSPIETSDGVLVAATIRDVTERRRELLEERNRRMQETSRLKSEFLANMSHELRTPLNAIIGFAELMHAGKTGPIAEPHREYLGIILDSSRHLLQLLNDLLDLAKVESGRLEPQPEPVELVRVGDEVKDLVRGLAAGRHIELGVAVDPTLPPIHVDRRMLKQVLYNYLSNAIKFTADGGRVALRIHAEGDDHVRIDVEDTGVGIHPADLGRLFVEFQQLDQGIGKRYPGTGLGLALTKRIVEAHGGRVAVVSVPGRGSTFTAVLPRQARPAAPEEVEP